MIGVRRLFEGGDGLIHVRRGPFCPKLMTDAADLHEGAADLCRGKGRGSLRKGGQTNAAVNDDRVVGRGSGEAFCAAERRSRLRLRELAYLRA